MERTLIWIRDHPQFAAVALGGAVVSLVLAVLAVAMTRSGASLRPLLWFAGFFAIVAGPQAVVHLMDGLMRAKHSSSPTVTTALPVSVETITSLRAVPWSAVFGPKADPVLITDAKRGLAAILDNATEAKLSFNTDGESALAASFPSAAAAARALTKYGEFFALAAVQGSDATGWTARRHGGQGEWVHVVAASSELYAWTGAARETVLARRVSALGPIVKADEASEAATNPSGSRGISARLVAKPAVITGIVLLNLFAAVGWFFKGSAWAARIEPVPVAVPNSANTVVQSLLALNRRDRLTAVARLPDGTFEVTWRYADARWWDLIRVHQMKRVHRLVLHLDEMTKTARVREYWSAFDAAAGPNGLQLAWTANTGIQFFALEHQRVLGAQIGSDGKFTGKLSKAHTFNLQALKAPVINVVTDAGWRWQPVTWNAPAAWRWLTE